MHASRLTSFVSPGGKYAHPCIRTGSASGWGWGWGRGHLRGRMGELCVAAYVLMMYNCAAKKASMHVVKRGGQCHKSDDWKKCPNLERT